MTALNDLPEPPYLPDTKDKGWRFEIDLQQVQQSDTWALASPEIRPWLLMLWVASWQQVPCGSMPSDDKVIAARIGMPFESFKDAKDVLMRGWWMAGDGRLYHETITARVIAMLDYKKTERDRQAKYRAEVKSRKNAASNTESVAPLSDVETSSSYVVTRDKHVTNVGVTREYDTSTGTRTSKPTTTSPALRSEDPEAAAGEQEEFTLTPAPAKVVAQKPLANCPVQKIVDLYHECMPDNPTVKVISKDRIAKIKGRWLEASALTCKPFGYKTTDEGLAAWRAYFEVCSDSDFLTNKTPPSASHPNFKVDFDFLISPKGFSKALENRYH